MHVKRSSPAAKLAMVLSLVGLVGVVKAVEAKVGNPWTPHTAPLQRYGGTGSAIEALLSAECEEGGIVWEAFGGNVAKMAAARPLWLGSCRGGDPGP